uniref:Uncharacterized protein n=1 Tax=Romanomermis culicivorax TaxID=13658 RepID=A0A915L9P4_ROMCU
MGEREKNRRRQRKKEKGNMKVGTKMKVATKNRCLEKRDGGRMRKKVGVKRLKTTERSTKKEKKKGENRKNAREAESHEVERGLRDITNTMIGWTCPTPVE